MGALQPTAHLLQFPPSHQAEMRIHLFLQLLLLFCWTGLSNAQQFTVVGEHPGISRLAEFQQPWRSAPGRFSLELFVCFILPCVIPSLSSDFPSLLCRSPPTILFRNLQPSLHRSRGSFLPQGGPENGGLLVCEFFLTVPPVHSPFLFFLQSFLHSFLSLLACSEAQNEPQDKYTEALNALKVC